MYIVHNLTNTDVNLSDLRLKIGPRQVVDLETIVNRGLIERSKDLLLALKNKRIALARHASVKAEHKIGIKQEQTVSQNEKNILDEQMLSKLIKDTISEQIQHHSSNQNITDTVKEAVNASMSDLISSIRQQIGSVKVSPIKPNEPCEVSPEKLAELSHNAIQKITEQIETGGTSKNNTIRIINKRNVNDLANEI